MYHDFYCFQIIFGHVHLLKSFYEAPISFTNSTISFFLLKDLPKYGAIKTCFNNEKSVIKAFAACTLSHVNGYLKIEAFKKTIFS